MTLGVDAGGGATGLPSADGSVGAGGAAGGSGGRAGRPGIGRPDVSRFTPTRFYERDCLHPNERGLRVLTHAIVQRYFVCPEGPPCVHDPTRRRGRRRRSI